MWAVLSLAFAAPPEGAYRVEWDRKAVRYQPRFFTGVVDFDAKTLTFEESRSEHTVDVLNLHDDGTFFLGATVGAYQLRLAGIVDKGTLTGLLSFEDWPFLPADGWTLAPRPLLVDVPAGTPTATPEEVGLDRAAIEAFVRRAREVHSSGFVLMKQGKVVVHQVDLPGPHNIQSITKPVAAMGIGLLIEDGLLPSLDTPLGEIIDEWKGDPRGAITMRHVLSHTSGLAYEADPEKIINDHPDRDALVLESPLEHPPGTKFAYSNRAMGLVAILVKRLAKKPLDTYVEERVLTPLGIEPRWPHDKAGSPVAFGGIALTSLELAQLGQLFLDGGKHQGKRLLPKRWTTEAAEPSPYHARIGVSWFLEPDGSYGHSGGGGQWLHIFPKSQLVYARIHRMHPPDQDAPPNHGGRELLKLVSALQAD